MARALAIFLHTATYDRVYQAASLLAAASSMGRPCYLFLFYDALRAWVDGAFDDPDTTLDPALRRAFEMDDGPRPTEIVEMARRAEGGVVIHACSTSVRRLGFEPGAVNAKVDAIAGLSAMLDASQDAQCLYL